MLSLTIWPLICVNVLRKWVVTFCSTKVVCCVPIVVGNAIVERITSLLVAWRMERSNLPNPRENRWIDHKPPAMKAFHRQERVILESSAECLLTIQARRTIKQTLEGKRKRIAQGSVLLKCAMYVDILEPAQQLSLVTQSTNEINIIQQVEKVESTLKQHQIMQCRVQENWRCCHFCTANC